MPRIRDLCDPTHRDHNPAYPPEVRRRWLGLPVQSAPDVSITSYLSSWQGYGQIAEWLGRGLDGRGYSVGYRPIDARPGYIPVQPWVSERVTGLDPGWTLTLAVPQHPHGGGRVVRFTMWESSRIGIDRTSTRPVDPVDALNHAALVIVPCRHNVACLRDSGVTSPIEVVPLGIDPGEGYRDDGTPFPDRTVFGMAGRMAHGGTRKNLNDGMRAFVDAFPTEDVELRVKVFADCLGRMEIPKDPRIKVDTTPMLPPRMAAWYRGLTCLFVPSRGEGWGLHTHQAMACGRPVIAAPWGGTVEFADDAYWLDFDLEPAGDHYILPDCPENMWAVPRHDSMVEVLRRVYRDPDECRRRGRNAAARAAEFTWGRTARELEAVLVRHGFLPADSKLIAAIESCDFRSSKCSCLHKPATCLQAGYPASVTLADCTACLGGR